MSAIRQTKQQNARSNWAQELWQTYIASGDLTSLLIVGVLLLMPALSLNAADWPIRLGLVLPVLLISLLFGYFLSRSRYNELYTLIVSGLYGIVTVGLVAAFANSWNPVRGLEVVVIRSVEWVVDAATGGINQDNLVFSMLVAILFWFFGYNSAWHMFRIDRVWRVILPPALILLVNMVVYAGDTNIDIYLMIFVLMSLLLIVRSNLDAREWDWYVNGVRVPKRLRSQFIGVGAGLSLLALLLAWGVPSGNLQERLDNFQQFLASDPVRQMAEFWNRLVEPIESDGPPTADYYGGDTLNLGGAIQLGDQVIMVIDAPTDNRYYWRSRVFERYSNGRWMPSATRRVPDLIAPLEIVAPPGSEQSRINVDQTVTMSSPARLIYAAPQPVSVGITGRIDLLRTNGDQDDPNSPMNVSVIRPERVIQRGQSYDVTSAMSVATAFELREAGTNYPEWVLSPNASAVGVGVQTAELARRIVTDAGATNPYDQAKAIERYLRTNITYNESIPAPPAGVDPVEWFLFTQQEGYCTYYATAMVGMLRSLGIPARMAAGFSEGEYDPDLGQFVVRERDAHTWVEVYFPGYGWVEFEPTSSEEGINREGDDQQAPPPPDQQPTAEPTMTPTLAPTATPQPTATPEDFEVPAGEEPPTMTPTPSPTPTVTPMIVPTVAPPVAPPDPPETNFLSFLLPAIGFAFLLFISILVLVLLSLFLYWWWELRGMGSLSPVSRAYARLLRYLGLLGLQGHDDETPDERRQRVVRQLPQAKQPIDTIMRGYTAERYGRQSDDGAQQHRNEIADRAWVDARRNILLRWLRRFNPFSKDD